MLTRHLLGRRAILAVGLLLVGAASWSPVAPSLAVAGPTWDGVWNGKWDDKVGVSIRVTGGKAIVYKVLGTPINISFSKAADSSLVFGDLDHYSVDVIRTGDATAVASYHGRHGYSTAKLKRVAP
jgi:hypothetical protein